MNRKLAGSGMVDHFQLGVGGGGADWLTGDYNWGVGAEETLISSKSSFFWENWGG